MGYPIIFACNGDEFARVNHDGSWSVRWRKTLNVRYLPINSRNKAIIACSVVLLAAKDNFYETAWEDSDAAADKWDRKPNIIDVSDVEPEIEETLIKIAINGDNLARVNYDGTWSVQWDKVEELARETDYHWKTLPLISFCKLLKAAKYNFPMTPWEEPSTEDDE